VILTKNRSSSSNVHSHPSRGSLGFTFVVSDMEVAYLEESVIDMLACDWERKFKGREDITRF
jgi:hypothetical protein